MIGTNSATSWRRARPSDDDAIAAGALFTDERVVALALGVSGNNQRARAHHGRRFPCERISHYARYVD